MDFPFHILSFYIPLTILVGIVVKYRHKLPR